MLKCFNRESREIKPKVLIFKTYTFNLPLLELISSLLFLASCAGVISTLDDWKWCGKNEVTLSGSEGKPYEGGRRAMTEFPGSSICDSGHSSPGYRQQGCSGTRGLPGRVHRGQKTWAGWKANRYPALCNIFCWIFHAGDESDEGSFLRNRSSIARIQRVMSLISLT